ncbi:MULTISPECIES: methyltransferase domain-containing protein [Streptomyces]|uniref:Protein-L-isoaspartate O-methyltransferase n=4 Tax=Streptomyces rimosus TaxID=1927 RepID=L8F122_STRR1|nr:MULTISPECIES: methyltransferase domain-containing protein [Streptomyces]KOG73062.1 protein-L-isoaspartate(D-aspartate) O-methyltransferase [Kitasatospora aureofaciens]MYT42089.1 methyltransferase domain-containing protein [Streptomyces sp. SID5471]KEF04828.1 protein-L-isoaspartate(D-aspartate) O-methyltransferase [Streptomyces rimosus]KOT32436.1 protein-L-isoaspartate(D-aspartate) O-methyltransferase [Streptomyces sp. NRRL WC-3701]KOT38613.1 protein-L-isoaspartate(D-aspartate) O-methyltrans
MAKTAAGLRRQCMDTIDTYQGGYFHDRPWLRTAFAATPREHFTPDRVWWHQRAEDGRYPVLDRHADPDQWLQAVYTADAALVTQIADGAVRVEDGPTTSNDFTSSLSCPLVVVNMLHHLDPQPGDAVLEIGTGTGYSTALLAARVGARNITTVEIDATIAERARDKLNGLGLAPTVVVGDGEQGHPARASYDRLISTAAVQRIPPAWLDQMSTDGTILTPLATPFGSDALALLRCDGHGAAEGRLVAAVNFMPVRGQRGHRRWRDLGWFRFPDLHVTVDHDGQDIRIQK